MTITKLKPTYVAWPDHTQLPETDGSIVQNFQEHPQTILLTDCIQPILDQIHPDGQYAIGQDCGIYWNLAESLSDDPVRGAKAPDWFYVPNVPPLLNGEFRRSYVLWHERIAPLILLEIVSDDGAEEHDTTPMSGKFWVYERAIQAAYYGIFDASRARLEVYRLVGGTYTLVPPNERGHYPIEPLGLELGIWRGSYRNMDAIWMRWWDAQGKLLPTSDERAEQERQRAEQERQRAEQECQEKETAQLRAEQERQEKETAQLRAEQERQRAEQERQRAERLETLLRSMGIDPDGS